MNLWIFVALTGAAIAVALFMVLPPLLRTPKVLASERRDLNIAVYRDQLKDLENERDAGALSAEQFAQSRQELEARLAEDALVDAEVPVLADDSPRGRWAGWVVAGLIPVLAIGLYVLRGSPAVLSNPQLAQAPTAEPHGSMDKIEAQLANLQKATQDDPTDGDAWVRWGMANLAMERLPLALEAFQHAAKLMPQSALVLAHQAEAMALNTPQRSLDGEPMQLVERALQLAPDEPKALELAGIYAYQHQQWGRAVVYWKRLLAQMTPEEQQSGFGQNVTEAMRDAQAKAGGKPSAVPTKRGTTKVAATISGRLELAPTLQARVAAGDTVFIFARAGAGGPPLAALRVTVADLPYLFTLDDSLAMAPSMALSSARQVTLTARISRSGQPKAMAGDLEGSVANVKIGAQGVRLLIDRVHP